MQIKGKEIAQIINERRKEKKLKITELAALSGVNYMQLYDSLNNKSRARELKASELIRVCTILGINDLSVFYKKTKPLA